MPGLPIWLVIREKCSQAVHILDRLHIVKKLQKAVDNVRYAEAKRMVKDGHQPILKQSRWRLLKRPETLTPEAKGEAARFAAQPPRSDISNQTIGRFGRIPPDVRKRGIGDKRNGQYGADGRCRG